ncbi:hypothetical protein NBRC111452_565 [Companilactobacillus farciminis]|jgi:hypothetical protein|nr:hypothetical protein NBRC111452_565 [Companilactobacillus farciminis]
MKIATPKANGVANSAANKVTLKEVTIIGKAPISGCPLASVAPGFQFVLVKKSKTFT